MEQMKTTLKAAFYIALLKLLPEIAAILCTLYSSYIGRECCRFQDFTTYKVFYLASIVLSTFILVLLSSAEPPESYDTFHSYWSLLIHRIKIIIYFLNPFRLVQSAWEGNNLKALADILMLQTVTCLAATLAIACCELRPWTAFLNSYFLKPEILLPAVSSLTLLRLILLTKNLCFSDKEEEPSEDDWFNTGE